MEKDETWIIEFTSTHVMFIRVRLKSRKWGIFFTKNLEVVYIHVVDTCSSSDFLQVDVLLEKEVEAFTKVPKFFIYNSTI